MRNLIAGILLAFAAIGAQAQTLPAVANPELEKRVMAIAQELRCLVCQNQTIADSNAELAVDLRNQVREKLVAGMSKDDIVAYMVERYGDFVLYRPPVKGTTWLLWFGPFALLLGGLAVMLLQLGKRQAVSESAPDSELKRAAALLAGGDKKEKA